MGEARQLPQLRTWFGVQYPDIYRVARVASREDAETTAGHYPGAIPVSCPVSDWAPLDAGDAIRHTLQAYSEWLEDEGAMVGIHLEPLAHDELVADFLK